MGAGSRSRRRHTSASIDGSRWAKVPTAPEILPTAHRLARALDAVDVRGPSRRTTSPASTRTSSARRARRACGRSSACARCSKRASLMASASARRGRSAMRSQACTICSACAVSTTSDEVSPKCSQRADGPTFSATAVVKAITSCCVIRSISSIRAMSKAPFCLSSRAASAGMMPGRRHRVGGGHLHLQPGLVAPLLAPDAAHLGMGVPGNHRPELCSFDAGQTARRSRVT